MNVAGFTRSALVTSNSTCISNNNNHDGHAELELFHIHIPNLGLTWLGLMQLVVGWFVAVALG